MSGTMLAFWLLAAIAAGGALMFALILTRKPYPKILKSGHGWGALAAVALLAYVNFSAETTADSAWWALGLFTMGLMGGVMFFRVLFRARSAPAWVILGHGSLGGLALYFLYQAAF